MVCRAPAWLALRPPWPIASSIASTPIRMKSTPRAANPKRAIHSNHGPWAARRPRSATLPAVVLVVMRSRYHRSSAAKRRGRGGRLRWMSRDGLFDTITALTDLHSPSGWEQEMDDHLRSLLGETGRLRVDEAGNMIVSLGEGDAGRVALLAHKDEIG